MENELSFDLIDLNGNVIRKEELVYIGRGCNASVWKYEKEKCAIKIFYPRGRTYALSFNVFKRMKNLELVNIVKAQQTLYEKTTSTKINKQQFDAYKMEYIETEKQALLDMKMTQLLQNLENLDKDIFVLSNNHIEMHDVNPKNIIWNKEDSMFHLIDIDMYEINRGKVKTIYEKNNIFLYILLRGVIRQEINSLNEMSDTSRRELIYDISSIFSIDSKIALVKKVEELAGKEKDLKTYVLSRFY